MKNLVSMSFLLFISLGMVYSQNINVTSPVADATWFKGQTKPITWTKSGVMVDNVKLTLRNADDSLNMVITMSTPNNGTYSWSIPNSVPDGFYKVRVKTTDNLVWDNSDPFSIADPPEDSGILKIIQPTSMWSYTAGGNMTIIWTARGILTPVSIHLHKSDNSRSYEIKDSHPSDGSPVKWGIPSDLETGKYYITVHQPVTGGISAKSGNFTINAKTAGIHVFEPLAGVTRLKGKVCPIKWNSSNLESSKVMIRLVPKSGSLPQDLSIINGHAENKEGQNSLSWTIPGSIPDGKYSVSVEKPDGSVKDESGSFGIGAFRGCDLAISSAELCSGNLKVTVTNNGDHYTGKITILQVYDMYGKGRISIPVLTRDPFILFSGKSLTLSERNNTVHYCSMNYSLILIPDKDHKDKIGGNNQFNGVAYKDCNVRECNKPDLWFEKVWEKKKYHNSSFQAGDKVKILAELRKSGKLHPYFTVRVTVYYHKAQFDPWSQVTEKRWRIGDFNTKKELNFTFVPQNRGYYIFEWMADIHNEVKERDESNNKKNGNEFIWEKR